MTKMAKWIVTIAAAVVLLAPAALRGQTTTRIVMLGTGTPRINPDRSGPATAIAVGDRAYLVDIGPGVVRRAAAAAASVPAVDPTKLSIAFITHLHSDHTAGYPDLMLMPWIFGRKTLDVYGPEGTEEMTKYLLLAYRRDIDIRRNGMEQRPPLVARAHDVKPGVVFKDDRVTVKAFKVPHGDWPQAFGYRFETPDRVIVISGDTSPSDEVVANCRPCDVLIHEVQLPDYNVPTMPDWPAYRARYHTTTDQLAELANRAKPGLLIAYHNGGTADALTRILEQIQRSYKGKVVVARDLDVF
jgi:ribonuclease Z